MRHQPGIYFGLSSDDYHADEALGSTSIRAIIKSPRKFWLRSAMNPERSRYEDKATKATTLGTALHRRLLDGDGEFYRHYVRRPDDFIGASPSDKGQLTKQANKNLQPGQILLHGDEWQLIEDSKAVITSHPDLSDLFEGGDHEVSVFWTDENTGTPLKCRFDILKPRGIGDIKTIANESDAKLEVACKLAIKRYKYHIQAEHYLEGRRQILRLFKEEKVFIHGGAPLADLKQTPFLTGLFNRIEQCAKEKTFAFQLIFASKALPEVWACTLSPGNPLLTEARDRIDTALSEYAHMVKNFGTKLPWPDTWHLGELHVEDMPGGVFGWE